MKSPISTARGLVAVTVFLLLILAISFAKSFSASQVMFSSDGPLGYIASQWQWVSGSFSGFWQDLNWIGSEQPTATPNVSTGLFLLLGPVGFLKFYVPLTLLILGLSGWFLFKQLGLSTPTCILGAFAVAFNTHPFSYACWGLGSLTLTFASSFVAMGLLASPRRNILHVILAGLCVGMGIAEGFDNGAIMSLYVASWLIFLTYVSGPKKVRQLTIGAAFVAIMAVCAALLAAQTLHSLITTQIQGVSGTAQDNKTKEERWDWATQWSLPKAETLRIIIPGIYGYRMDTPEGGEYWGAVGQQPGWEKHRRGMPRHSGSGEYAGVLVCLLAIFPVLCAWGKSKTLSDLERRMIWFWFVVGVISLFFSYGRHAPFFKIVYSLPYFSTIRNPIKYLLPFQMAVLVLFGFGVELLYRRYQQSALQTAKSAKLAVTTWWKSGLVYERRYGQVLVALLAAFLFGFLIYSSSATEVRKHIASIGFSEADATAIHKFSLAEVRWSLLFAAASVAVILLALSGWFAGPRLNWLTIALGLILVTDLYRANKPWVVHYNYKDKYELSSLLAVLKEQPFERRVTTKTHPMGTNLGDFVQALIPNAQLNPQNQYILHSLYNEWLQHQFQYYRIQSLDISQMPRVPELDQAFMSAFMPKSAQELHLPRRLWELTNTRWILGDKALVDVLNLALDAQQRRFRVKSEFNFVPKPGRTAVTTFDDLSAEISTNGAMAIIEFTGALPRAKFYNSWRTVSDDVAALQELSSLTFDPDETLIVNGSGPASSTNSASATASTNNVQIVSYEPREWRLQVENSAPGILLLNDRWDDDWSVTVNGQAQPLLRCNHIMRGVQLSPGKHEVAFNYSVPKRGLYISFASIIAGVLIVGFLGFTAARKKATTAPGEGDTRPQRDPK
ncbi:MAG TPA: YfhO family protein [Verrucomicrobiae bacterium]